MFVTTVVAKSTTVVANMDTDMNINHVMNGYIYIPEVLEPILSRVKKSQEHQVSKSKAKKSKSKAKNIEKEKEKEKEKEIMEKLLFDINETSTAFRYKTLREMNSKVCILNMSCKFINRGCEYKHGHDAVDDCTVFDNRKNIPCKNGSRCEYLANNYCAYKH
jgi:hypothetical protein